MTQEMSGTATNLHDALAIHRGEPERSCGSPQLALPTSSEQILVVVMDASPGFSRRGTGLFILWPVCSSCGLACSSWRGWQYRKTEGPSWWTSPTSICSTVWAWWALPR